MANLNDPVLAGQVAKYNRRIERKQRPWYLLWFVLVLALLLGYATYDGNRGANRQQQGIERDQQTNEQVSDLVSRLVTMETLYDALYSKFEACVDQATSERPECADPGVPPSEDVAPSTTIPSLISPQPSQAQVRAAVTAFCTDTGQCAGQQPTPDQVTAAVLAYCGANGQCRGEKGESVEGDPGPEGPPPSDAQVLAAVTAFCATGACTGPQGPIGPAGPICPEGWNPQELLVLTLGEPVNIYTCTAATTQSPPTEETP